MSCLWQCVKKYQEKRIEKISKLNKCNPPMTQALKGVLPGPRNFALGCCCLWWNARTVFHTHRRLSRMHRIQLSASVGIQSWFEDIWSTILVLAKDAKNATQSPFHFHSTVWRGLLVGGRYRPLEYHFRILLGLAKKKAKPTPVGQICNART